MAGCLAAATCAENLGKENDELRAENSLCKGQIGNQEASRLCWNEKAHLPGGPCPASGTRTLEGPQPLADERASRQRAGQAEPASSRGLGSSPGRVRRDPPRTPGRCVLTGFPSPHACRHSWGRGTKRGPCGSTGRELGGPRLGPHFSPCTSSFRALCAISVTNPSRQSWEPPQSWGGLGDPDTITKYPPRAPFMFLLRHFLELGKGDRVLSPT